MAQDPVPAVPAVLAATGPFFMFSLEETFELIGEAGFDGAELMIMQDKLSQDPHRLGALAARYGVPVPAVHGPFLVATWLVFGTDPKGKLERCIRFAEAAKVSTVVIHPPYRWQTQYAAWLDEAIPRIREEAGITVAVENMFPINVNGRSLRFFSGTAPAELDRWPSLVLDTSHLAVVGGDLLTAWDELADRVAHLHVSNNDGRGRDTHGLLDRGVLPIGDFLEEVGAGGFGGAVTLELDVRTWADDRPALRRAYVAGLAAFTVVSVVLVALARVTPADLAGRLLPEGKEFLPVAVRVLAVLGNVVGTVIVVGGAVTSGLALRSRRDLRPRFEGNLLIALGVLLAASGGVFAFLASSDKLALGLALGASVMYLGFRRASVPVRPAVPSGP